MKVKVRVELDLDVNFVNEDASEVALFEVVRQELCDMLYVAVEPDPEDILSVNDLHIRFMKVQDGPTLLPE